MKEHPILFQGAMVRAILAGTKTQTRRALRAQPPDDAFAISTCHHPDPRPHFYAWVPRDGDGGEISEWPPVPCPYGAPGDRLWVRETCRGEELPSGEDGVRYVADDAFRPIEDTPAAAIDWLKLHTYRGHAGKPIGPKVPGIHMPRWACRLLLEVVAVRVERLQAISEADAVAEGCAAESHCTPDTPAGPAEWNGHTACEDYAALWESINGPGSWDANPWVWVVEFRRLP